MASGKEEGPLQLGSMNVALGRALGKLLGRAKGQLFTPFPKKVSPPFLFYDSDPHLGQALLEWVSVAGSRMLAVGPRPFHYLVWTQFPSRPEKPNLT